MGQATVDLPDPLENPASPAQAQTQSADDLLSQLAGDEIDRLLAESGEEVTPGAKTPPIENPAVDPAPAAAPAKTPLEKEMDLDAAIDAAARERLAIRDAAHDAGESTDASPQIDLGSAPRLPFFLRPLEWLSAPLDPWPDQIRDLLGKVGLMTLINALAVIAYVLIFRRHHH